MEDDRMIREAKKRFEAAQRRRAKAVHDAATEHVTARVNELHHLVGITIAPEMVDVRRREELEAELLEAINRARAKADDSELADGDYTARRMAELLIPRL